MISRRKIIGAKTETAQGTPATLVTGDFFHAYDIEALADAEVLERKYHSTSLDPFADLIGKKWQTVKFKTDLKGAGAAGTVPAISPLLQAVGLVETISAGVSVSYAPVSVPFSTSFYGPGKSTTIKVYEDGLLYTLAGCVGNLKLMLEAGKIGSCEWEMKGVYAAITDAAPAANSPINNDPPVMKSSTFTLQTYAAVANKLEIDFGNQIAERPDLNSPNSILGFQITDRNPVGSADPEAVLVATHDYWGKFLSGAVAQSSIVASGGAGNICTITLPKTQYSKVSKGDRNGLLTFEIPLKFSRNAGDDWLSLVFT